MVTLTPSQSLTLYAYTVEGPEWAAAYLDYLSAAGGELDPLPHPAQTVAEAEAALAHEEEIALFFTPEGAAEVIQAARVASAQARLIDLREEERRRAELRAHFDYTLSGSAPLPERWIDGVRSTLRADKLTSALGLTLARGRMVGCPCCGAEKDPAGRGAVHLRSGWKCYPCGAGGDALSLICLTLVGTREPSREQWRTVASFCAAL